MPNIAWLTIVMAAVELTIGVCLLRGGREARWAALAVLGFFCFLLALGYGWPTMGAVEDFAKNRLGTLVMAAIIAPVAWGSAGGRREVGPGD